MSLVFWILRLYPPGWRERYEAKMVALLSQQAGWNEMLMSIGDGHLPHSGTRGEDPDQQSVGSGAVLASS
jgi:hypothetical protein